MHTLPQVVTRNYDPNGVFLGNVCDLPPEEAEKVLQGIRESGRRAIKANYLCRRLDTEAWLVGEKRKLLGPTRRERPIYFFLGNFADGKDLSRPRSIVMPLAALPPEVLTFTYLDSMANLPMATRNDLRCERQPYHGQVFTLQQIERVVEEFGMPGELDRFIEVQVWDERPILKFLKQSSNSG